MISFLCLFMSRFKFISGESLLAVDLGGTSDPYCILRFVDDLGVPVSSRSFKTKVSKKTLSPIWNEQVVFESDYGFQRATFAHIEVCFLFTYSSS